MWSQFIQLGDETTAAGTAIASTVIWRGDGEMISDDREITFVDERTGILTPTLRSYTAKKLGSLAMAATPATFEQLPYIFEAGISDETASADGDGSDYIYNYVSGYNAVNTLETFTIETGDGEQAEEMAYCFVESFTLSGNAGEAVMVSANWLGREPSTTTKTPSLAHQTVEDIFASEGVFAIDAITGTAGTGVTTSTLLSWTLNVTTGWKPRWTCDSGEVYFAYPYFDRGSFDAKLDVVFEHNATSKAEKVLWLAETPQIFQIKIVGSDVTTPGTTYSYKTLILEMVGKYEKFESLGETDGSSTIAATIKCGWDEGDVDRNALNFTVVNELSALV